MRKRLDSVLCAALLLPVLLFAVAGSSFAAWRCQFDGVARAACCCPKGAHPAGQARTIEARDCCSMERYDYDKVPSELSRGQTPAAPEAVVVLVAVLAPLEAPVAPSVFRISAERPPGGRSLLLRKQTFLI